MVERDRTLGHSPIVVACAGEPAARRWVITADERLTGRVSRLDDPEPEAAVHARTRMFLAAELDLHCGRLRGFRVPKYPARSAPRARGLARRVAPGDRAAHVIPARYLR